MSIRTKAILTAMLLILVITGLLIWLMQAQLEPHFASLEAHFASDTVSAAYNSLEANNRQQINALGAIAQSEWLINALQAEAQDIAPSSELLKVMNLDLLIVVDQRSQVVRTLYYDEDSTDSSQVPDELLAALLPYTDITRFLTADQPFCGYLNVNDQIFHITGALTQPANPDDSAAALVIGGQRMQAGGWQAMVDAMEINITFVPAEDYRAASDRVETVQQLGGQPVYIYPNRPDSVSGSLLLTDPFDEPTLVLSASASREQIQAERTAIERAIYIVMGISALGIGGLALVVDRLLVSRVQQLHSRISSMRETAEFARPLTLAGNDEVTNLSAALTALLGRLAGTQRELRKARDEAVEALAIKTQILSNVNHDARTPLSIILLRAELLLSGRGGPLNERQRSMLIGMEMAAHQMLRFITNLMMAAQLSSKPMAYEPAALPTEKLLHDLEHSFRAFAAQQQVTIVFERDPAFPSILMTDPECLKQAVANLIDNAVKFSPPNAQVIVRLEMQPNAWQIQVQDSGVGMSKETIGHMFETFFQGDNSATRSVNAGSGLGLSVVKLIVEQMGGQVSIHSLEGKGTLATLTFPTM